MTNRKAMGIRRTFLLAASALVLAACGGERGRFSDLARPQQLCGGYTGQRELTDEEMEMFRSVTGTGDLVFTPLSVSTQVVAGTNYRFYCRFEDTGDGVQRKNADDSDKYGYCWITVFKPLPGRGEPKLTSIDKEG